jgi:hypothetical protein
MNSSRLNLKFVVAGLFLLGFGLIGFRYFVSGIPFLPGVTKTHWAVEARIQFQADDAAARAAFVLPAAHNLEQLNERTASPGFNLRFIEENNVRRAEWAIDKASGKQTLYYLTEVQFNDNPFIVDEDALQDVQKPQWLGSIETAAQSIVAQAQSRTADPFELTREFIKAFKKPNEQAQLLLQNGDVAKRIVELLNFANIPARTVSVLVLEDGARNQGLRTWVQVFNAQQGAVFDPTGELDPAKHDWIIWEQRDGAVLELEGGHGATVAFSMLKKQIPVIASLRSPEREESLLDISIHSLPLSEQALFKSILLVPVGVLIVVFMRILVGLKTSGTFMPVLIALSFMQTSLVTGLVGFLSIVGVGLVIRSYLSKHNLLLVARIALVILCVVLIMSVLSVGAFRFGLSEGLKLTFFPMIILSWTIERMSILWEEEGAKEVVRQGGGSLLVAVLAFLVMSNGIVQHLTFHFIGLQFIFMGLVILCGSYTGYRLSELKRFKQLVGRA